MTDYTKFDSCEGASRTAAKPTLIDLPEALDRCTAYGLIPEETATTLRAYKDGYNDAVIQFQGI